MLRIFSEKKVRKELSRNKFNERIKDEKNKLFSMNFR